MEDEFCVGFGFARKVSQAELSKLIFFDFCLLRDLKRNQFPVKMRLSSCWDFNFQLLEWIFEKIHFYFKKNLKIYTKFKINKFYFLNGNKKNYFRSKNHKNQILKHLPPSILKLFSKIIPSTRK